MKTDFKISNKCIKISCVGIKLIFYITSGSDNRARARIGVETVRGSGLVAL